MLTYDLSTVFSARGVKKGYSFLKKLGLGHPAAHKLRKGNVRAVRLDHIEKICLELHCTPNDLLVWTPDDRPVTDDHPLNQLKKRDEQLDLIGDIRDLPLDKIRELKEKLAEWVETGD